MIPLLLAASTEAALRQRAARLAAWIEGSPELDLEAAALALAAAAGGGERRAGVLGATREELLAGVRALASSEPAPGIFIGRAVANPDPVFLFPGQGAQWPGMGLDLRERSDVFAFRLAECAAALDPHLERPLMEILESPEGDPVWRRVDCMQPALFAIALSLTELWRSFGVEPAAVVGHSLGDVAAAVVAGALPLEEGARVSALWAAAQQAVPTRGAMAVVELTAAELEQRLLPWGDRIDMAGANGPRSAIASGDEDAVGELMDQLAADGVRAKRIEVAFAAHSRHLEPVLEGLVRELGTVGCGEPRLPFYSAVDGRPRRDARVDASYWAENVSRPVRFEETVEAALADGWRAFVEIGPHPMLTVPMKEMGDAAGAVALATTRRGDESESRLLVSLVEAHVAGVLVDWERYFAPRGVRPLDLAAAGLEEPAPVAAAPSRPSEDLALRFVQVEVTALLGLADAAAVDPGARFGDLGLDSAAATTLANRLGQATGVRLPASAIYDYPTAVQLAGYVATLQRGETVTAAAPTQPRSDSRDPIAIVGMACRFPGGASSPEGLWELLARGGDAIGPFPTDRGWDPASLFDPDPDRLGKTYCLEGGFLEQATEFDASFFGISPREALAMDPQQRLLLECAWEALERAGIDPTGLAGQGAGVFAGVSHQDYGPGLRPGARGEGVERSAPHRLTGTLTSVLSGRVAYSLGLEGPAVSVDTACSSSLVATHLAAASLRNGECDLALAGGVTVMATAGMFLEFSQQRGLAPDGRAKAFSALADGTVFSEGAGLLVLERLSDAEANGHRPLALIRGSAINQDGASNGLSAPNGPSQERVIRQALANSGLEPADVDAVEAHGTGTALGDPIEAGAILAAYGHERGERGPLALGSLKSNIGHAQGAAGVGGVIKIALALQNEELPRTLHADEPTPHVDWSSGEVELLTESRAWPRGERPRRAGISSFGISGTNAHLILEEAPAAAGEEEDQERPGLPAVPLLLSAKAPEALAAQGEHLAAHLQADPDLHFPDLAHTLISHRAQLEHRALVVGADADELGEGLAALARGAEHPALRRGRATSQGKVAFLFPGQGSQWAGMGRELLASSEPFARRMAECEQALAPYSDFSVVELIEGAAPLERIEVVQPALFAIAVSLAELWRSHGLVPDAVLGHSQGEIAAAVVAGALSLEDGALLTAKRSALIAKLVGKGAMVSLALPPTEARALISDFARDVHLAAINGPGAVALACGAEALPGLLARCEAEGVRAREVAATVPTHSPFVQPLAGEVAEVLASLEPHAGEIAFHSTVDGGLVAGEELGAAYWYGNLREPVQLQRTVEGLIDAGFTAVVEVSPHPVLATSVAETAEAHSSREVAVLHTLRRDQGGPRRLAEALGEAHLAGVEVDLAPLLAPARPRRIEIPTYPFQRQRFWLEAGAGADPAAFGMRPADHPLLAGSVELAGGGRLFTGRLSLAKQPWLADHALLGRALVPGVAIVELCLRAGADLGAETLEELTIEAPMLLAGGEELELQVRVGAADEEGRREVEVHSRARGGEEAPFARNASGWLAAGSAVAEAVSPGQWPPPGAEPLEIADLYELLAERGFDYGPALQGLESAWKLGEEIYAEVSLAPEQTEGAASFGLHPALFDAALHPLFLAAPYKEGRPVPFSFSGVSLHRGGADSLRVRLTAGERSVSLLAFDSEGEPVLEIDSLAMWEADLERLGSGRSAERESLFALAWSGRELGEPGPADQSAAVFRCEPDPALAPPAAARELCERALAAAQTHLAREDEGPERLCFLTEGAVAAGEEETPDPAAAAVWGLIRVAISEHPGRFCLIDTDGSEASEAALAEAFAQSEEAQLALREGAALVPRLAPAPEPENELPPPDPEKTVLITGATGTLGAAAARHLVERHGARHLLLLSRRGEEAAGAPELRADLEALGASIEIKACDVTEHDQLAAAVEGIDPAHPLGVVVHCAAALADALFESQGSEKLKTAFAAKADGAYSLHELSESAELTDFVLYSSLAGLLGNPGQANYAAANAFCDALAQQRRAEGLPATSIAWGYWAEQSELTSSLGEADRARLERGGMAPLETEQGLALFDSARAHPEALVAASPMDRATLRRSLAAGTASPLLRGLAPAPRRRSARSGAFASRLGATPAAEREPLVVGLVREHAAAILGHESPAAIDPSTAFKDLGFDSLGAVELRNRLSAALGERLEATLVFDYPSPAALGAYLLGRLEGQTPARAPVRAAVTAGAEPIAIVGMACRFPGGASSPEGLWELLARGGDAIGPFPSDRGWDPAFLFDPDPDRLGHTYCLEGGFLPDATDFDASFFGISPREALAMDPQQRLLLECAWEALERAGIDPGSVAGESAGVFAGAMATDYLAGVSEAPGETDLGGYLTTGVSGSVLSGRVAYSLGLEGPAVSVDTACSSSLVATHLAAASLRSGECDFALAGGVTVMATPGIFIEFSRQRGLANDGRSKSFSAAADGSGFSEGAGVLVLERLSDAEANGHRPLALIRGSATNQDGASNGLTAPNGPSQERVIRQALANSGLEPGDVDAVEAHGTGTSLGDPIEAGAILAAYGQERGERGPLALGSLKSNIGHAQAAAGVGGVIKMALALQNEELPRTLHAEEPTPHVDWSSGEVELLAEPREWPRSDRPRRAGISSFGISGTNAHLILEEPPVAGRAEEEEERPGLPAVPLLLSAKAPEALAAQGDRLVAHLRANPGLHLPDLAHTLFADRAQLEHRALVVGADAEELGEGLAALARGAEHPSLQRGRATSQGKVAFLFPGQGSQWAGMGRELLASSQPFARSIARCEEALEPFVDFSLTDTLRSERDDWLSQVQVLQPALFAVMVSLAEVWRSHGVSPDAVLGHSQGEIAAAVVAGALSLGDGARVSALRAVAIAEIAGGGGMVALALAPPEVEELISGFGADLSFAAHNGAAAAVVSGTTGALKDLLTLAGERGVRARRIPVDYASHSPQVEAIEARIRSDLAPVAPRPAEVELFSSLNGERIEGGELDADYWYRSLREPVRFADAAAALVELGGSALIEVSPHPVLTPALSELAAEASREVAALHTLRRDQGGPRRLAEALGEAHLAGVEIDLTPLLAPARPRAVEAPTYPFQRQRYWLQASGQGDPAAFGMRAADHPLLTGSVELADGGRLFTGRLSLARQPWLADHALLGRTLVPGVAIVELCLRAGADLGAETLEELTIEAPMLLSEGEELELQVRVGASDEAGRREVEVHSRARGGEETLFVRHASGWLTEESPTAAPAFEGQWPPPAAEPLEIADLYALLAERGFEYGPALQGLETAWVLGGEIYAEVSLATEQAEQAGTFGLHPALFDAALHPLFLTAPYKEGRPVPFSFAGVSLHRRGAGALRVRLTVGEGALSLFAADSAGQPVVTIDSLATREADPGRLEAAQPEASSLFTLAWSVRELDELERAGDPAAAFRCEPDLSLSVPAAARELCERALAAAQAHLAGEDEGPERLCFLTEGAVATGEGETPDPAQAAVWGLVRVAISEHPGRFCLVDSDGSEASEAALADALAQSEEPQLALREGAALVPRLAPAPEPREEPPPLDPEKTVLVTGATGTLGALTARHLVTAHGGRHLLLLSRRGEEAPGAKELKAELEALGAQAQIRACDVADRDEVAAALAAIADDHPLAAVVHCAAGLHDALLEEQGPESLETAFAAKAEGAFVLHELCKEAELTDFVLFSSLAGMTGNPGLAAYAAANAFCDAFAQGRLAAGEPATSIAWGHWAEESGLTADLSAADRARLRRGGLVPMPTEQGLELFDRARACPAALVAAGPIDRAAVRRSLAAGTASPLLAALVPAARRRSARGAAFAERLAAAPAAEREGMVRGLVAEHAAAILGHESAGAIDASASFKDLGFDSLGAVELRNRLSAALGERLEATLIFDYPSPAALGAELAGRMQPGEARGADDQEQQLRRRIAAIPLGRLRESGLLEMLLALEGENPASESEEGQIDEMDLDSLVRKTLETSGAEGP